MITSKNLYKLVLCSKIQEPTAINKWLISYPFLEKNVNWEKIYTLPYKITKETYLHTFQFKILNRILNCNEKLFTWGKVNTNTCSHCIDVDTIEHHLFYCPKSNNIWDCLSIWLTNHLQINHNFTICEVIFGTITENNHQYFIINFLILITKWHINKCKTNNLEIYFFDLLYTLKQKLETYLYNQTSEIIEDESNTGYWLRELYNAL